MWWVLFSSGLVSGSFCDGSKVRDRYSEDVDEEVVSGGEGELTKASRKRAVQEYTSIKEPLKFKVAKSPYVSAIQIPKTAVV